MVLDVYIPFDSLDGQIAGEHPYPEVGRTRDLDLRVQVDTLGSAKFDLRFRAIYFEALVDALGGVFVVDLRCVTQTDTRGIAALDDPQVASAEMNPQASARTKVFDLGVFLAQVRGGRGRVQGDSGKQNETGAPEHGISPYVPLSRCYSKRYADARPMFLYFLRPKRTCVRATPAT